MAVKPLLVALRALGLGDFLTGIPAYRALAAAFPGHRRLLAAPPELAPLLPLEGSFHGLLPARPLQPLGARLEPPDVAVNLHGRGPQSHRLLLELGPRRPLAFASPGLADGPAWRADEHELERWCRMLRGHGIPADPDDLELVAPRAAAADGSVLLAHPGAASPARRWPVDRWVELLAGEVAARRHVVLSGGPDERALAEQIAARVASPRLELRAGSLSLLDLVRLVARAELLVCGDTGVAHLATALRTPSVLLFGPTSPAHWGPPPGRSGRHRVLWKGTTGDPHAQRLDPGLARITVAEVRDAIASLRAALAAGAREPEPAPLAAGG